MSTTDEVPEDIQDFASKLFNFAREGDMALAEYIDQGVDVNMSNQDGNSFLMLASYSGHPELVDALIARGADVNKANNRFQTPLAGVIFKKEDAIIEALFEAGADPFIGTPNAVDTARMFGRDDLVAKFEK